MSCSFVTYCRRFVDSPFAGNTLSCQQILNRQRQRMKRAVHVMQAMMPTHWRTCQCSNSAWETGSATVRCCLSLIRPPLLPASSALLPWISVFRALRCHPPLPVPCTPSRPQVVRACRCCRRQGQRMKTKQMKGYFQGDLLDQRVIVAV